jgi:hypothetical protein
MHATALTALLVLTAAPKPDFEAFTRRFAVLELPATFPAEGRATLAAAEAMAFVIAPPVAKPANGKLPFASAAEPARRAQTLEAMADPKAEGALQFTGVGRLPLSGAVGLVVRRQRSMMMGSEDVTVLLIYTPQGAFKTSLLLADQSDSEAGGSHTTSTVSRSLEVSMETHDVMPLHDVEGVGELQMTSTSSATISPQGTVVDRPSTWTSAEGEYQDRKSHEVLLLSVGPAGAQVWYRAKDEAPPQKLSPVSADAARRQLVVHFPRSPKPYVLTSPADFSSLSCKNPDGSVQQFERMR